jgi:hypothetical protein
VLQAYEDAVVRRGGQLLLAADHRSAIGHIQPRTDGRWEGHIFGVFGWVALGPDAEMVKLLVWNDFSRRAQEEPFDFTPNPAWVRAEVFGRLRRGYRIGRAIRRFLLPFAPDWGMSRPRKGER